MPADIKGRELLLRTLNELLRDGTLEDDIVEEGGEGALEQEKKQSRSNGGGAMNTD